MDKNTEVIFENIEQRILKEIANAHYAIFVSVAWFTNKKLFHALLEKAQNNCYVSIIIQLSEINLQCGIDYNALQVGRSECFMVSNDTELLHDKFCIIDFKKVLTGSYNWTYKASENSENIVIISDPAIAIQYISRFEQQKVKYADFNIKIHPKSNSSCLSSNPENNNTTVQLPSNKDIEKPIPPAKPKCPSCHEELVDSNNLFCTYCGHQQGDSTITLKVKCEDCSYVQKESFIDTDTKYCTSCGSSKLKFEKLTL